MITKGFEVTGNEIPEEKHQTHQQMSPKDQQLNSHVDMNADKKIRMAYGDANSKVYVTDPGSNTDRFEKTPHQQQKQYIMEDNFSPTNQSGVKLQTVNEFTANINTGEINPVQIFSNNVSNIELVGLNEDSNKQLNGVNIYQSQNPFESRNEHAKGFINGASRSKSMKHFHAHEGYNALNIPADWDKAEQHASSRETKPELDDDNEEGGMQSVCECCGYELSRRQVGLNVDVIDLGFLGSGFPLFYNYIRYCCFMLLSLFIIQGIPNIIYNLQGTFCHSTVLEVYQAYEENKHHPQADFLTPCPQSNLNSLSLANSINRMKNETNYGFHFSVAATIAQLFLGVIFRRSQRMIESKVDEENSTPSDYTIMVENISQEDANIESRLRQEFSKFGNIQKVNLVYDIEILETVEHKLHAVIKKKQAALLANNMDMKNQNIKDIDHEIEQVEKEEHSIINQIKQTKFVGTAFISFETEQQKQDAIEGNPQNSYKRFRHYFTNGFSKQYNDSIYMDKKHLYVSEAPEPNDIDWEFAHVGTDTKITSRIRSFFEWAFLSAISFGVIFAISYYQHYKTEKLLEQELELGVEFAATGHMDHDVESQISRDKMFVSFLSYFMSLLIVVWNKFALPILIHKICDHEKWSTKTSMNISFAQKLTLGLFFNTALITFFVEVILLHNVYAFAGGMILNELNVFIMNAIIPSLAWIIDPWKILQDMKRKKMRKDPSVTQEQANLIMEHPSYSMGKRYADIMKTMWFTFFYSSVIPIGTIISLAGLICYYFTDKYNLLFRRTVKESIGPQLSFKMVDLVDYSLIFHTFGEVFFKYNTSHYFDVANFVLLFCVFVLVVFVPLQKVNEYIFEIETKNDDKKYSEVELTFDTDYDRENPITKKESIQKFQEMRNKINDQL